MIDRNRVIAAMSSTTDTRYEVSQLARGMGVDEIELLVEMRRMADIRNLARSV